jgi:tol-pal system protein YbgF
MRLILTIIFLAASLAVAADSQNQNAVAPQPSQQEILNNMLNDKVMRLENSVASIGAGGNATGGTAGAISQILSQIDDLRDQTKKLRGDIEQLQFESTRLSDRIVKLSNDIEFRLTQLEGQQANQMNQNILTKIDEKLDDATENLAAKGGNDDSGKKPVMISKDAESDYEDAYQFIKDKNFAAAKDALLTFTKKYPDLELTGNAFYWIGEISYQSGDYDNAAVSYLRGYQVNPRGIRAPDNLYKLASCLYKLQKRNEACISLNKLNKEFPNLIGSIRKQADEDYKKYRCQ